MRHIVEEIESKLIAYRRDFHHYAEVGWTEFRTASLVARRLTELGWQVQVGRDVVLDRCRMGVPPQDILDTCWQRAVEEGGDLEFLNLMKDAFTGVVGVLEGGDGPTIAVRFDMDAMPMTESHDPSHRPFCEGFASIHKDAAHTCGHDAHIAIGLGVAEVLMRLKAEIRARLKLIFQPAEEGVRGAKSMVCAGVVDDVDYLLGLHVMSGWALGEIVCGTKGHLATSKFDVIFTGAPAHAGGYPQGGKNALSAAATAVLNLHAIPRHANGMTRVNVGELHAGTGRNVICPSAHLVVETRGATSALNMYMYDRACKVVEASAVMYGCDVEIRAMGSAPEGQSDAEFSKRVERVAAEMGGFKSLSPTTSGGSEDFTYMMRRVQERGGLATRIGLGADFYGISSEAKEGRDTVLGHHTPAFDIDEGALKLGVELITRAILDISTVE